MLENKAKTTRQELIEAIAAAQNAKLDCRDIPIDLIDFKDSDRTEETVPRWEEYFRNGIETFKILEPILVRPKDDGRFDLICGHRRLNAARKLEHPTIPARLLSWPRDPDAIKLARHIENIGRRHFDGVELEIKILESAALYERLYGSDKERRRRNGLIRAQTAERNEDGTLGKTMPGDQPARPRDPEKAGFIAIDVSKSERTVYNVLKRAKAAKLKDLVDDDDEETLPPGPSEIARDNAKRMQELTDVQRSKVADLEKKGIPTERAIRLALPSSPGNPGEESLSDADWIEQHARGPARDSIEDTDAFDREALLYRNIWPIIQEKKKEIAKTLGPVRSRGYGPLSNLLGRLLSLQPPSAWKTCPACQGSNQENTECPTCRGTGFLTAHVYPKARPEIKH